MKQASLKSIQPLACRRLPFDPQQYDQLLQADDAASRSALLQGTVTMLWINEAIKDLNAIEQVLMKHLYSVIIGRLRLVLVRSWWEIFTLRYHNLKFSQKRSGQQVGQHLPVQGPIR